MRKMLLAAAALAVALAASAQEPKFDIRRDSTRTSGFTLPDSLAHMSPWKPDYKTMAPVRTKPTVSMTSVVVIHCPFTRLLEHAVIGQIPPVRFR